MAVIERDAVAYTYENTGFASVNNYDAVAITLENTGFAPVNNYDAVATTLENGGFGKTTILIPTRMTGWGMKVVPPEEDNFTPEAAAATAVTYEGDVTA